ncbi:MAG: hypothetical protein R3F43_03985 [bacterium]
MGATTSTPAKAAGTTTGASGTTRSGPPGSASSRIAQAASSSPSAGPAGSSARAIQRQACRAAGPRRAGLLRRDAAEGRAEGVQIAHASSTQARMRARAR